MWVIDRQRADGAKIQDPSTKLQRTSNHQASKSDENWRFGGLKILWNLDLGVWIFF
jgi:hypothetical protein